MIVHCVGLVYASRSLRSLELVYPSIRHVLQQHRSRLAQTINPSQTVQSLLRYDTPPVERDEEVLEDKRRHYAAVSTVPPCHRTSAQPPDVRHLQPLTLTRFFLSWILTFPLCRSYVAKYPREPTPAHQQAESASAHTTSCTRPRPSAPLTLADILIHRHRLLQLGAGNADVRQGPVLEHHLLHRRSRSGLGLGRLAVEGEEG